MKTHRIGLLAFTLGSVVAFASAHAADMYVAPPAGAGGYKDEPYVAYNWSGFYAGVQGGWAQIDDKQSLSSSTFALKISNPADSGVFGGHLGYNLQSGKVVYGIEADLEGNGIDKSFVIGSPFANTTGNEKLDWQGSVRGRLGYEFWNSTLVYATAGWAYGHFVDKYDTAGPTFHQSVDSIRNGWTVGGGLEYPVAPKWSVSAEYRFTDWGTHTNNLNVFLAPPGVSKDEVTEHTVRAGVSYHIGQSFEPLK
jgi:outer membrane immunogenic protein